VARQWQVERYEVEPLRCIVNTGAWRRWMRRLLRCGESSVAVPTALLYTSSWMAVHRTASPQAPFAGQTDQDASARLAMLTTTGRWRMCGLLARMVADGGQMELPDTLLNELHKSIRTTLRSHRQGSRQRLIAVPPPLRLRRLRNEACWQITMFDQAGHHDRAETYWRRSSPPRA